ncbi:MAG: hypothetical protein IJT87_02540 [Ruminiclostridium sp.]|nr:hypothetical protein [Ruminiclostridium sp.]
MRTKYTTSYSSVDDRFGFSRKGIFRCRIRSELLLIITVTVVSFFLEFYMLDGIFGFADLSHPILTMNNTLSGTVFGLLFEAGALVLPFVYVGVIRTVLSGEEYSFTADERKMLIICPRRDFRADIFYEDVQNVTYSDIVLMNKHRGYSVDIICGAGTFHFDFLFPYKAQKKDKEMTPFVIIEERSGLLEKPEFYMGRRIDDDYFREGR